MYPDNIFQWVAGIFIMIGVLGLVGMFAWGIDKWYQDRLDKKRKDREGNGHGSN